MKDLQNRACRTGIRWEESSMQEIRDIILDLWKPNSVRSRYGEFKPQFVEVIGADSEKEYDDLCKTIEQSAGKDTILVDGGLRFVPKIEILKEIKKDLPHMDLSHITSNDLILFSDPQMNQVYLNALNYTVNAAAKQGLFPMRKQQENFISNQIVFSIEYLLKIPFASDTAPKIIYYSSHEIEERDFWFLVLCYLMGFDVIVLEPSGQSRAFLMDADHLIHTIRMPRLHSNLSFAQRASQGQAINVVRTTSATLQKQIGDSLYGETGVYRPWSFRKGHLEHALIDGNLADLEYSWKSEARMREGFQAEGKNIRVPNFFIEIDGVDRDRSSYFKLVNTCIESKSTLFDREKGRTLLLPLKDKSEMVRLVFAMSPNGEFSYDKLKVMPDSILKSVSPETGKRIVEKLNETMKSMDHRLSKEERIKVAGVILSMSAPLLRLLENYDFPFAVPKVVLFLEDEDKVDEDIEILLNFLSLYAFDIAVFSPAGYSGLSSEARTVIRLDDMIYNFKFPEQPAEEPGLLRGLKKFFGAD